MFYVLSCWRINTYNAKDNIPDINLHHSPVCMDKILNRFWHIARCVTEETDCSKRIENHDICGEVLLLKAINNTAYVAINKYRHFGAFRISVRYSLSVERKSKYHWLIWQTDGHTDTLQQHSLRYYMASRGKKTAAVQQLLQCSDISLMDQIWTYINSLRCRSMKFVWGVVEKNWRQWCDSKVTTTKHTGWAKKVSRKLLSISSPSIVRFSNFSPAHSVENL